MARLSQSIALIYMGGTFGCCGEPLIPLAADQFLPLLQQLTRQDFPLLQHFSSSLHIRDSSQLIPQDWQHLVEQIDHLQAQGYHKFLLLHGTDTLAYTAAFLAEYFYQTGNSTIQLVLTGSQYPLLQVDGMQLEPHSDALLNLKTAYIHLNTCQNTGCWVAFDQQVWTASSVQKIHTTQLPAFTGINQPLTYKSLINSDVELHALTQLNIATFYLLPVSLQQQATQLMQILQQPQLQAIILLAFGAGNLAQHELMQQALQQAQRQQTLVILASQVPFGGVHLHYAAGHWLVDFGILPAAHLTIPAIYARLALLFCQKLTFAQRHQCWQQTLESIEY